VQRTRNHSRKRTRKRTTWIRFGCSARVTWRRSHENRARRDMTRDHA